MIYFVVVAVLVAATALLIRLFLLDEKPRTTQEPRDKSLAETQSLTRVSQSMHNTLPAEWNDQVVIQRLISMRERPPVLAHFVDSLIGRFVIGQNDKTAEKRTHLIRTVISQLEARKDLQVALDDLEIHSLEREIRFKEKQMEHAGLVDRQAKGPELENLRRQKEKLELEVEIARLEQEKSSYQKQEQATGRKQTREELREAKKKEIKQTETEMAEAILDVTRGTTLDQLSPDEQDRVMRIQNFYNDKKIRLDEELAKI